MNNITTPGVYIREISTIPASIAGVETAIPAFIGYTQFAGGKGDTSLQNVPTRIRSLLDFRQLFGGAYSESIKIVLNDTLNDAGEVASRSVKTTLESPSGYNLYYALQMYFNNGGGPCYLVSIGSYDPNPSFVQGNFTAGIDSLEKADEPTLLLFPEAIHLANVNSFGEVVKKSLTHCAKLQDRFTISDVFDNGKDVEAFRGVLGLANLKYGAVYHPYLQSTLNYGYDEATLTVTEHNNHPAGGDLSGTTLADLSGSNPSVHRSILAAMRELYVVVPPSGAVAGIYARIDAERGVWKAPANTSVNSVIKPTIKITNADQGLLNVDPTSGKSINAIRNFTGRGTLVWGARTLAGNDNEWRYVPVRRLFIYVEESVKKATEFVVFEPNDANTWLRVKTMIENFLAGLWRDGALDGATTSEAFFVNVGLGQTMTAQDILNGRLNVEIGLAAVRPAEFIILKFSHLVQES